MESYGWSVTWCRAFPTLLNLYCGDEDLAHQLRPLAWQTLYPNATATSTCICKTSEWQDSLGYGEIVPETVFRLIHWMRTRDHLKQRPMTVFDLGSGDGKVILATALCLDATLVGLEIVPDLHQQAMLKLQQWTETSQRNGGKVEFHCDDFTRHSTRIAQDADLIWIHATVFGDMLFANVQEICESCRPGTLFVLVSRPLRENTIETLLSARLQMSWGDGMVFVQRRIPITVTWEYSGG
jgi:Histone methylation protein DOT1